VQWSPELNAVLEGILGGELSTTLLLAPLPTANHVEVAPGRRLVVVDDLTKPKRLRALAPKDGSRSLVRAHPLALPIAPGSIGALVAVDTLSRWPQPERTLAALAELLREGGLLVVVERLAEGLGRALYRLARPGRQLLPPEAVTGLLLNAGFARVGQSWPGSTPRSVITSGRLAG
jgi:hypothetical protein